MRKITTWNPEILNKNLLLFSKLFLLTRNGFYIFDEFGEVHFINEKLENVLEKLEFSEEEKEKIYQKTYSVELI